MREIKFRAYSNDAKTMYPYAIQWFNWELWVHKNNLHNGEWKNIWCGNDEEIVDYSYELMQFTWLLDKNGKEIYEGDLIKSEIWDNYTVVYTAPCFFFEEKWTKFIFEQYAIYVHWMEIIWNIFENADKIINESLITF